MWPHFSNIFNKPNSELIVNVHYYLFIFLAQAWSDMGILHCISVVIIKEGFLKQQNVSKTLAVPNLFSTNIIFFYCACKAPLKGKMFRFHNLP